MHTDSNSGDTLNPNPTPRGHAGPRDLENPGYETTDVNVSGVATFLGGLLGSVVVFFFVCFALGILINNLLKKADGPVDKWHQLSTFAGPQLPNGKAGKREDLSNNPELEQKALAQLTTSFPSPRLDTDDGDQATADLHAREDLLLENYSSVAGSPDTVRVPIERAMQLIAERGLPVVQSTDATQELMVGDSKPVIQAPLTTGFARTGYELETIEAREQKMSYSKAETEAK